MHDIPTPPYPFRHKLPVQIRFNDLDMLGHVNNTIYMQMMDLGKIEYIKSCLVDHWDWHRVEMVIAHIDLDFYEPTLFEETLQVWTEVVWHSEKCIGLLQRIVNPVTEDVKVQASTVMVHISYTTRLSSPVPGDWLRAIEAYEGHPIKLKA